MLRSSSVRWQLWHHFLEFTTTLNKMFIFSLNCFFFCSTAVLKLHCVFVCGSCCANCCQLSAAFVAFVTFVTFASCGAATFSRRLFSFILRKSCGELLSLSGFIVSTSSHTQRFIIAAQLIFPARGCCFCT